MSDCNKTGSINDPNGSPEQIGTNNPSLAKYVPYKPEVGSWEISGLNPDSCANNDQLRQESYVAEVLNISGAPINVFKLLGVHEQGTGSVLNSGTLISSQSYPGFPLSNINSGSYWKSFHTGQSIVTNSTYLGIDFGERVQVTGVPAYSPSQPNFVGIGSISITQANTPNEFARQVKVEIADGTCKANAPLFYGNGNGELTINSLGPSVLPGLVVISAITSTEFSVVLNRNSQNTYLGNATLGNIFRSTFINFTISEGSMPFSDGDFFTIQVNYDWKRMGLYNLTQSPEKQIIGFDSVIKVNAIRILPTLFSGTGNWEVSEIDFLDSAKTDINNIQDLFFNENRDRDYAKVPLLIKAQYNPADSSSDLSRFGLSILDQYTFTVSFASMVSTLGRPIVIGDIVEVIPELQYDQNLKPVRKFLEVSDTGWASEGFSPFWKPTVFRFSAQQALPSQETRDIFGTIDTQKYITADKVLDNNIGSQIDVTPLTALEELVKNAKERVPETGSDDEVSLAHAIPKPSLYTEDGLPPNGLPYTEGYALPDVNTVSDGDYFRLYYQADTNIPPRLYRYSAIKHRWVYQETDRRGTYSSHRPEVQRILQSSNKQSLRKK